MTPAHHADEIRSKVVLHEEVLDACGLCSATDARQVQRPFPGGRQVLHRIGPAGDRPVDIDLQRYRLRIEPGSGDAPAIASPTQGQRTG